MFAVCAPYWSWITVDTKLNQIILLQLQLPSSSVHQLKWCISYSVDYLPADCPEYNAESRLTLRYFAAVPSAALVGQ